MKSALLIILCTLSLMANEIRVAVAANVSYALDDLIEAFYKKYPHIKVIPTLSGSGSLTAQIINKAPYDIFMSADMSFPAKLYELGIAKKRPKIYAKGLLVLVSKENLKDKNLSYLKDKSIKTIAIANPKIAPYGKAALQVLKKTNLHNQLEKKYIYAHSISQTLAFALSGADVGFVAKSSLYSKNVASLDKKLFWNDINTSLYSPIAQGVIELKNAKESAKFFYNFLFSKAAKEIFKAYGYLIDK